MKKMRIGLALGSGAAKGFAHIGVLRAFEESGIEVDLISGTSMGAVIGGLFASGKTLRELTDFAIDFGRRRIAHWMDPSFFRGGGLLKGGKIEDALVEFTGPLTFSDLKMPFYAVASDMVTGSEVVLSSGDVHRAIRASFAIPGIFAPVKWKKHWLVDGALSDPIPTKILKEVGCNFIIGVNVNVMSGEEQLITSDNKPSIIDVVMQTLAFTQQKIAEPCMKISDVNIVPAVGDYSWTDFRHAEEIMKLGYKAAKELVPEIRRLISRRRIVSFVRRVF